MRRALLVGGLALALAAPGGSEAVAGTRVTVGLYAPSTPFSGPSERLQYVTKLAAHLNAGAPDVEVVGRVFARASDLQAAIRRGTVQYAVLDAPYAASRGLPYYILASAGRGGRATSAWSLVAKPGITGLRDLAGKTVALPRIGSRDADFLTRVLLEGQVQKSYFHSVTAAPDSFSAVTMVKLGRASAAFVPSGVALPAGVRRVTTLRQVGLPMFVALPGADKGLSASFAARIRTFGDGPLASTSGPEAGRYRELRAAFASRKRPPSMAVGRPARAQIGGLVSGRSFQIRPTSVWGLIGP